MGQLAVPIILLVISAIIFYFSRRIGSWIFDSYKTTRSTFAQNPGDKAWKPLTIYLGLFSGPIFFILIFRLIATGIALAAILLFLIMLSVIK